MQGSDNPDEGNPSGGPYYRGNIDTGGGNFAGRDHIEGDRVEINEVMSPPVDRFPMQNPGSTVVTEIFSAIFSQLAKQFTNLFPGLAKWMIEHVGQKHFFLISVPAAGIATGAFIDWVPHIIILFLMYVLAPAILLPVMFSVFHRESYCDQCETPYSIHTDWYSVADSEVLHEDLVCDNCGLLERTKHSERSFDTQQ